MRVMRDEKGMRGIRGHKRYEREEGYEWCKRYEGSLRAQSSTCLKSYTISGGPSGQARPDSVTVCQGPADVGVTFRWS